MIATAPIEGPTSISIKLRRAKFQTIQAPVPAKPLRAYLAMTKEENTDDTDQSALVPHIVFLSDGSQREILAADPAIAIAIVNRSIDVALPVIRCFCVPEGHGSDVIAHAYDEDGKTLATHYCSEEGFAKSDIMGHPHTKKYEARYPQGYRLEWVGPSDMSAHWRNE